MPPVVRIQPFHLFFVTALIACGVRPAEDPIVRPVISAAFYRESTERLEQMLQMDTANTEYMLLQLNYYDKLGWPSAARTAVSRARELLTLDPVVARMYADFYWKNSDFDELDELFLELDSTFEQQLWTDRYKVRTYLEMGRYPEAVSVLERILVEADTDSELAFWAGRAYLAAGDTASAFFQLRDALDDYQLNDQFLKAYLPLALEQGKANEAALLAEGYLFQREATPAMRVFLADVLYTAGVTGFAKQQLWKFIDREALLTLSSWYESEGQWDSAHYCADRILLANDQDLEALFRKADIDQSRGWLARASRYYEQVLEIDSTNVRAQTGQELIRRKIAYLRRIRAAQQQIPVLDLNSKKEIN